jgi:hypothetical protein
MRKIIHANDATTRVTRPGEPISFTSKVSLGEVGVRYNYDNVGSIPFPFPEGLLFQQSSSLILRIHPVDLDGKNHANVLASMETGDTITVGTQTGTLASKPSYQGPYWNVPVAAFPALTPAEYRVKVARP